MTATATETALQDDGWKGTDYYYIKDVTWDGKVGTALSNIPAHITISRDDVEDVDDYASYDDIKSDSNLRWHVTADVDEYGSSDNVRFFYVGDRMSWNYKPNDDNWNKWKDLEGTGLQVNGLLAAALSTW